MVKKIKQFFIKIKPSKRKLIQLYAALLYNANIKGFITGDIFKGSSKSVCLPGLNCYSCPGAIGACPLGSLQNALSESKTKVPTYVLGIILLYAIILGRTICGFLCPVGLIQELLYKIKTPKLKKNKITRILSYFKYVLLLVLVLILPLVYALQKNNIPLPAFCKYICPAGTLEGAIFLLGNPSNDNFFGMLGPLFTWKFLLLITFLVAAVFIFRFFCRFFCPLGAIYGLFNKLSILGVKVDKSKCNNCQACINHCKMDVKEVGDHECIQCGECRKVCHCNAISWKTIHKFVKDDLAKEEVIKKETENQEIKQTKTKKISSKTFNIIISIILSVILVVVLITVNFKKELYKINDICEEVNISFVNDNSSFDIKNDEKATLLYFYKTITNDEIELLKKFNDENLNVLLVSSYNNRNITLDNIVNTNIIQAYDKKNKTIKMFSDTVSYPYIVFLDTNDKIVLMQNEIGYDDYINIILPIVSGKQIGNQVGDICYNKKINLIGNDETFSIADNLGKVVVINFWFTSCTPCVQELPHFNKVYEKYKDDVTIIAIHEAKMYDNNPNDVISFINNQFANFSILFGYDDVDNPYYEMLGGKGAWPLSIIVNKEGIVSFVNHGSLTETELESKIIELIR